MNLSGEFFNNLSDNDKHLVSRILDMHESAEKNFKPKFTFFLDDIQMSLAFSVLNQIKVCYFIWGGYEKANRCIIGIFPKYYCENIDNFSNEFPIDTLVFRYKQEYKLSHRDFLGAFMSRGFNRNMIGDIIVSEGITVAVIYKNAAQVILDECSKIGSVGVKVSIENAPNLEAANNFIEISGTVSSLRLDCIVSLALKLSREKSALLIKGNAVSLRYGNTKKEHNEFISNKNELSPSVFLEEGDVFSIRGYGKFILESVGNRTKKDRLFVNIKKFI